MVAGNTAFPHGQVAQDLDTSASVAIGDPAGQATKNVDRLLRECGASLQTICKVTVYVTDIRFRQPMRQVLGRWVKGVLPAFTGLVVVALARPERLVEVDVAAVLPDA